MARSCSSHCSASSADVGAGARASNSSARRRAVRRWTGMLRRSTGCRWRSCPFQRTIMGSPSRNVQYHPPRLSEDRLNLPQPHSPSLPYTLLREIGNAPHSEFFTTILHSEHDKTAGSLWCPAGAPRPEGFGAHVYPRELAALQPKMISFVPGREVRPSTMQISEPGRLHAAQRDVGRRALGTSTNYEQARRGESNRRPVAGSPARPRRLGTAHRTSTGRRPGEAHRHVQLPPYDRNTVRDLAPHHALHLSCRKPHH